jgi:CHASE3 domain sensor protein
VPHDDVTVPELVRRLEDVRRDCREDNTELRLVVDSKVSMERYQYENRAREDAYRQLADRIRAIEEARDLEQQKRREDEQRLTEKRAADRRLIFTAIIAPILMLFLQLYLSARGAGQ